MDNNSDLRLNVVMRTKRPVITKPDLEEPKLVDTKVAADILGVSPDTMVIWRCTRAQNLSYIRVGRLIRYKISDLNSWIESRKVG